MSEPCSIYESWLKRQWGDWRDFEPHTSLVTVMPFTAPELGPETVSSRFIADFTCRGLVRAADGSISEANRFTVGIWFGPDHLRRVDPRLVTLLAPHNVWHPNVLFPGFCVGHVRPGIGIIDILFQIHGVLTFQNMSTQDYLNAAAADWARNNRPRFPIDRRPLKRRELQLTIEEVPA